MIEGCSCYPTWPRDKEEREQFKDWCAEAGAGNTILGFRDWIANQREEQA